MLHFIQKLLFSRAYNINICKAVQGICYLLLLKEHIKMNPRKTYYAYQTVR